MQPLPLVTTNPDLSNPDVELMRRVAANDQQAVADLYHRFAPLVYRMALRTLITRSEADDAVQEVFIRRWRTASRFDASRAGLVAWVMLITRRHLVDRIRRVRCIRRAEQRSLERDERDTASASHPMSIADLDERERRLRFVRERVDALPPLQRAVVTRAFKGGQTLRQIGENLNTPLGTVKTAMHRALISLRAQAGEGLRPTG